MFATNRRNFDTKIGQVENPVVTHLGSNPVKNIMPVTRSQTRHLRGSPYVRRPTLVTPRPTSPAYSPTSPAYRPTSPNPLWGYLALATPEAGTTPLYDPTATPLSPGPGTPASSPFSITSPMPAPTTALGWLAHYAAIVDYNKHNPWQPLIDIV